MIKGISKKQLKEAVEKAKSERKEVLEIMYDIMGKSEKEKMAKNDKVKKDFKRHGAKF